MIPLMIPHNTVGPDGTVHWGWVIQNEFGTEIRTAGPKGPTFERFPNMRFGPGGIAGFEEQPEFAPLLEDQEDGDNEEDGE